MSLLGQYLRVSDFAFYWAAFESRFVVFERRFDGGLVEFESERGFIEKKGLRESLLRRRVERGFVRKKKKMELGWDSAKFDWTRLSER